MDPVVFAGGIKGTNNREHSDLFTITFLELNVWYKAGTQ